MAGPSHWVICKLCGKQFDVEKKGGVYDGNRYICKSCAKKVKRAQKAQRIEKSTGEPSRANETNPWFRDNWKILFGIIFLIGGFGNIGKDNGTAVIAIIVGIGLIFAHFYPMVKAKRLEKAEKEAEQKAKEATLQAIADEIKFCKTCGARTKGSYCEYCGSKLD